MISTDNSQLSRVMRKLHPLRTPEDMEIDAGVSPYLYKRLESILL